MPGIENVHDRFFKRIFGDVANVRSFLEIALPEEVRKQLDLSDIQLEPTSYVSEEYRASLSDVVVKLRTRDKQAPVDVYILFEHKSYPDRRVLIQLLRYMFLMWMQDDREGKPLRVIIPVVFYHGKRRWKIPRNFASQFPVSKELRRFLLNFRYILFDTNELEWEDVANQAVRQNITMLAAVWLMKAAAHKNFEAIPPILELLHRLGLLQDREFLTFSMIYIAETQDIGVEDLTKVLRETQIEEESIMPTLAQRLREEALKEGIQQGIQQGIEKGKREGVLSDKQDVLIMLLTTRFQELSEAEKQLIRSTKDIELLNAALKQVLTAESKESVLRLLWENRDQDKPTENHP